MRKLSLLNILFYLAVLTLSLGQFAVISRGGGVPIYVFDFVVGIYALYGLFYFLGVKKTFVLPGGLIGFVIFTVLALLSLSIRLTTLALDEFAISLFYWIRWTMYLLSALVLFNAVKNKLISLNSIVTTFAISALFISLVGFVQLIVLPDFSVLEPSLGWDPHKNRLASTFFDPNFTGGFLALVIGLLLSLHLNKVKRLTLTQMLVFVFIPLIALFLTFSRSSWGMFAIIAFALGLLKSRWLLIMSLILMFLTYFAIPRVQTRISGVTDPADSATFRLVSWGNTMEIAEDNLLLGVGFNSFRFAQRDYGFFETGTLGGNEGSGSDSSFLLVLATTGIFGFLIFAVTYFKGIKSRVLLPLLLGLSLQVQFINGLFYPQIMFLWLILWGILD